jgi:hypothetical protein
MVDKKAYVTYLKDMIDGVDTDAKAEAIVDAVFAVPFNGLRNGDTVILPTLGRVSVDKGQGENCLSFLPENALLKCVLK